MLFERLRLLEQRVARMEKERVDRDFQLNAARVRAAMEKKLEEAALHAAKSGWDQPLFQQRVDASRRISGFINERWVKASADSPLKIYASSTSPQATVSLVNSALSKAEDCAIIAQSSLDGVAAAAGYKS